MQSLKAPQIQSQTQQYNKMGTKTTAKKAKDKYFFKHFCISDVFYNFKRFSNKTYCGWGYLKKQGQTNRLNLVGVETRSKVHAHTQSVCPLICANVSMCIYYVQPCKIYLHGTCT